MLPFYVGVFQFWSPLNHLYWHFCLYPMYSPRQVFLVYCCVAPLWLSSLNPLIEFRIWNNLSSSDVLYIQASISPKYESKSKTTSHCHLLLHDCHACVKGDSSPLGLDWQLHCLLIWGCQPTPRGWEWLAQGWRHLQSLWQWSL